MNLSRLTKRRINWQRIDDSPEGLVTRGGPGMPADRNPRGAHAFASTGSAALLGLFASVRSIGRDQAMLEVLPTRYELALQFATTAEDRRKILERFLDETASLRRD